MTTRSVRQAFSNPWLPFHRTSLCLWAVKFQLHETMEILPVAMEICNSITSFLHVLQNVCKGDHRTVCGNITEMPSVYK